ncbi:hypothetical protein D5F01_LYC24396 [Larimichthys crocea]|uniref:Uncharacterized protein n=1 Tax=Larimichthys crocea TaxID=215358 RepID=A0A6G0HF07_LARCR|nr:hypothetical protein D5F01_LYC24396 [Larimichthys crocea]
MVIEVADTIQQKPSLSLLLALMDLVDMEVGDDFESVASVDKAGVKHVLLAYRNYMSFYIPKKELMCTTGKKVVPVVTQYSEKHHFFHRDKPRSMVGTYVVLLPATRTGEEDCYFVQEVLFVPGPESLDLLKEVTQNKFAFWDMSLEVPTHPTALTPSFQQIQPCQLLRAEDKFLSTQSNKDALVSHIEEIHPMCCVVGTGDIFKKMRDSRLDCFTEAHVICKLTNFHYGNGGTRTVYFRRSSKVVNGKRGNMVPVVALRKEQRETPELYVSTTLRFFRAVKRSCVKGNGELVTCWSDTLKEFQRDSFIIGTDMYQEIQNPALTGFIKRVNPNSWCNYLPGHLESMIGDPIMIEVVEFAIKLMDSKIPNAFAVAELLYCPIKKVQTYLKAWKMYSSDQMFRAAVLRTRAAMIEDQMRKDWEELSEITLSYMRHKHGGDAREVAACAELLKSQSPDMATKEVQKTWQSLIKHDAKSKEKTLTELYSSAKVLFLKRRTYQNKLKKVVPGEGDRGDLPGESSSSHSTESQEARESSRYVAAEFKEDTEDRAVAGVDENNSKLYSIVTPDPVPVSTWLKNLPTLLLSEPWLNGDTLRREAVCTLLGLENTLLDKRYRDILCDWVIDNRTIVYLLQRNKLQDRLSTALVHCLETTSSDNWRGKILLSFQGTQDQLRGRPEQLVAKLSKNKMKKSRVQKNTATEGACSSSKSAKKAGRAQSCSSRHKYSYTENKDLSLSHAGDVSSEAEEVHDDRDDIPGEDLFASMYYDDVESLDDYDYSDNFIDDDADDDADDDDYVDDEDNDGLSNQ